MNDRAWESNQSGKTNPSAMQKAFEDALNQRAADAKAEYQAREKYLNEGIEANKKISGLTREEIAGMKEVGKLNKEKLGQLGTLSTVQKQVAAATKTAAAAEEKARREAEAQAKKDLAAQQKREREAEATERRQKREAETKKRREDAAAEREKRQAEVKERRDKARSEREKQQADAKKRREDAQAEREKQQADARKRREEEQQRSGLVAAGRGFTAMGATIAKSATARIDAREAQKEAEARKKDAEDKARYIESWRMAQIENANYNARQKTYAGRIANARAAAAGRGIPPNMSLVPYRGAGGNGGGGFGGGRSMVPHGGGGGSPALMEEGGIPIDAAGFGLIRMLGTAGLVAGAAFEAAQVAYKVVKEAVSIPHQVGALYSSAESEAAPFMDLRYGMANIGRAGGFQGRRLQKYIYDHNGPTALGTEYGLKPEEMLGILQNYGGAIQSPEHGAFLIDTIAQANRMPFLGGMGENRYAQSLGIANTLGVSGYDTHGGTSSNAQEYFKDLGRTMAVATAQGLDQAKVLTSIEGLLRSSGSRGVAVNGPALNDWWTQMMSSGSPSMRSGEGQIAAAAGVDAALSTIGPGGDAPRIQALYSYIQKHGGNPTTEEGLGKIIGGQRLQAIMSTGTGRQGVKDVLSAFKSGQSIVGLRYLADIMQGQDPSFMMEVARESASGWGATGTIIGAHIAGVSDNDYRAYIAGRGAHRPAAMGAMGRFDALPDDIQDAIKKASAATGLPTSLIQATMFAESRGNRNTPGAFAAGEWHRGLMQVGDREMAQLGYDPSQSGDPATNIMAGSRLLKQRIDQFGIGGGINSYHGDDPHGDPSDYTRGILANANQEPDFDQFRARVGAATTTAGEQGANAAVLLSLENIGGSLNSVAGAMTGLSSVVVRFTHYLDDWMSHPRTPSGGSSAPSVPAGRLPH
jgi:hypothetical protein